MEPDDKFLKQTLVSEKICAVFVTMNRSATAKECLRRLLLQTRPIHKVIVVNNASTDDTVAMVTSFKESHPEFSIDLLDLKENLGNAGGMHLGLEKAFDEGADRAWILDDDSWPELDAVAKLTVGIEKDTDVHVSHVIDIKTGNLSWPLQVLADGKWKLFIGSDQLPNKRKLQVRRAWLGALIPYALYKSIGPVDGRLFIRGEDEDYPRRLENAGSEFFLIRDSVLHHPSIDKFSILECFGRVILLERGLTGDRLYYRLRNIIYITWKERGFLTALLILIAYFFLIVRDSKQKIDDLKILIEAAHCAFTERLDKRS